MRIWKLISGIISIVLSVSVVVQSGLAGLSNTLEENVKYYKEYIEKLMNQVDDLFKDEDELKIDNIEKALKGEFMNLDKQYKKIDEMCKKISQEEEMNNEDL